MPAPKGFPLDLDETEIIRLYEMGNYASEIAKIMKCNVNTILRRLRKNKIVLFHNRPLDQQPLRVRHDFT